MNNNGNMQSYLDMPLELAKHVVDIVHEITGNGVNIMGRGGKIVCSSEPSRINTIHEGGLQIMNGELEEVAITEEDAARMKIARPGYMSAVLYKGKRICCIGISGDPDTVMPIQKMAAIIIIEEMTRIEEESRRNGMINRISGEVMDISERMGILSLNGSIQAARLGRAGEPFKVVASEMRILSREIGSVIASIEAER